MTLENIYFIASTIAAVGVVVSLVFVGIQVRQNTIATRSAAAQAVSSSFAKWYGAVRSDPGMATIAVNGLRDYDSLNDLDRTRLVSYFMEFNLSMQDAFYKWQDGALSSELWHAWEVVSLNMFSTPGGKTFWNDRGYMFGTAYQDHIDNVLLNRTPHAKAKPFGANMLEERGSAS